MIVGKASGLDHESAINLDSIATVSREVLIRPLGVLLQNQEAELTRAFHEAFDLED